MASHTEIKVGSRGEWVVRIDGKDCPVKVIEKTKKPTGRGYAFRVKRIVDGRVTGQALTRGSGAFRRPGQPARTFGGKAPPRRGPVKPKARPAPVKSRSASRFPRQPSARKPSSPLAPTTQALPSLRGRGRASARSPAKRAPARATVSEGIKFKPPSDLAKRVMRAIEKTDGSYSQIASASQGVLAQEYARNAYAPFRRA